jgi:hypothetical protein
MLTVSEDYVVTLQRLTAAIVVRVNDETIGVGPVELRSGTRIEFGSCRLTFETDPSTTADPSSERASAWRRARRRKGRACSH